MLHYNYDGVTRFLENNADMAGPGGSPAYFKPGAIFTIKIEWLPGFRLKLTSRHLGFVLSNLYFQKN